MDYRRRTFQYPKYGDHEPCMIPIDSGNRGSSVLY